MNSDVTRRRALRLGGVSLSACLAGCSSVRGLISDETELLLTLVNLDRAKGHEVHLEIIRADSNDVDKGQEVRKTFALAEAAATEDGEESNEGSQKQIRLESRPYLVRVWLSESEYRPYTSHFHFHPCSSEDLDRLFIKIVRDHETDELFIVFDRPTC